MSRKSTKKDEVALAALSTMYPKKLGDKNFRKTPRCIYFYYIVKDPGGQIVIKHYYYTEEDNDEIEPEELPARIIDLTANAKLAEKDQSPPPSGSELHHNVWTRKSYIVFLLDMDGYEFKNEGVEITSKNGDPNVTFYDGEVSTVDLPSRSGTSYFRCINHMKRNSAGNDLGRTAKRFKIKLDTTPNIPRPASNHDDGGTNMGPPVPPP